MFGEGVMKTSRTAHYYTLGEPSEKTHTWIIACHGYGQLASKFIRKFDVLARPGVFILAPEGLSRFYWQGLEGEVAASWMTRADRLHEIEDYCTYLSALYAKYKAELPEKVRIVLFGFSQGCATHMRWIMQAFPAFDDLVLWAGAAPEDLDYRSAGAYWQAKRIFSVWGSQDPYISPEALDSQRMLLADHGLKAQEMSFEGAHTVDRDTLARWAATYLF